MCKWPDAEYKEFHEIRDTRVVAQANVDKYIAGARLAFANFWGHMQVVGTAWFNWGAQLSYHDDQKNQDLCDLLKQILDMVRGANVETGDFRTWDQWFQGMVHSFTENRHELLRAEGVQPDKNDIDPAELRAAEAAAAAAETAKASASGASSGAGPGPSGASRGSLGASAGPGVAEKTPEEREQELKDARARIFGQPAPELKETPMIPRKTRHDIMFEKMDGDMEAGMGKIAKGHDKGFAETDKRDHSTGFFDKSMMQMMLAPDEAWITKDLRTYQIYARRVMQYTILCLNGERFSAMVNVMRSATIVTILEKYQSLLMSQGWNTLFFPPAILDMLCRRERGHKLTPAAEKQCGEVTQVLVNKCESLNFAIKGEICYATMRKEPTTVIGTRSCGADINSLFSDIKTHAAGSLVEAVLGYTSM